MGLHQREGWRVVVGRIRRKAFLGHSNTGRPVHKLVIASPLVMAFGVVILPTCPELDTGLIGAPDPHNSILHVFFVHS